MTLSTAPTSVQPKARIISTSSYLPQNVLSNQDLEKMVDTSDEWIFTRTGIRERRIGDAQESAASMGVKAAQIALQKANIDPQQIDLIIVATMTPDYLTPSTAALIQKELKLFGAAAFDMQAACTEYIYGLATAKAYIESGLAKNILLVATEKMSAFVDYQDRATCVLFGDGAAAAVVTSSGEGLAIRHTTLGADGQQSHLLWIPAGGSQSPASAETLQERQHYLKMNGPELFKHAVRRMENSVKECMEHVGLAEKHISWFIPHQANLRIIDAIAKRFDVPADRVYMTIHKYGNTSASSVAIALDEFLTQHPPQQDDNLLLVAFGAGLTWGSAILTKVNR